MNKKTVALTAEQYEKIIKTMISGFTDVDQNIVKPNKRIATALTLEATALSSSSTCSFNALSDL